METTGKTRKKRAGDEEEKKTILSHFPWLKTFDDEAKGRLMINSEIANVNVLKLITFLESNISAEVTKLRRRPNRTTKLLGQIKKRVCVVKVGGYLMDASVEKELFPTYGLLMQHFVDLTLNSSQITKFGAQRVAADLYYFLKLMFHEDTQFILDVVLCSTVDEHASSQNQVGFQLFSFIVEDSRCYCTTHPGTMKYCAVANLLSAASPEGQLFVDRNLPVKVDQTFPKYLKKNLNVDVRSTKKGVTFKDVVQAIRPINVKAVCRSRLVIVSKRNVSKNTRSYDAELNEDTDGESSVSTVVNLSAFQTRSELPSSSSEAQYDDPMRSILGDLGMLDSVGDDNLRSLSSSPNEGRVSSSSAAHRFSAEDKNMNFIKIEVDEEETGDASDNDDDCRMDTLSNATSEIREKNRENDFDNEDDNNGYRTYSSRDDDDDARITEEMLNVPESVYTKPDQSLEYSEISNEIVSASNSRNQSFGNESNQPKEQEADDSDLEVLSIKENEFSDAASDNFSRDEAEAESGEDVVPNYDEDSDLDADDDDGLLQNSEVNTAAEVDENDKTLVQSDVDNEAESTNASKKSDYSLDNPTRTLSDSMVAEAGTPHSLRNVKSLKECGMDADASDIHNVNNLYLRQSDETELSPPCNPKTRSSRLVKTQEGAKNGKPAASPKRKSTRKLDVTPSPPPKRLRSRRIDQLSKGKEISESEDEVNSVESQQKLNETINNSQESDVKKLTTSTRGRGRGKTPKTPVISTPTLGTRRSTRSKVAVSTKAPEVETESPKRSTRGRGRGRK